MDEKTRDDSVDERLQILEGQIGFQDRTIEALNEVVARQQDQIDDLIARVKKLCETFESMEMGGVERGEEPPPPHY